jgi:hypothetical protein
MYEESSRNRFRTALEEIVSECDQSNGGRGAELPFVVRLRDIAVAALRNDIASHLRKSSTDADKTCRQIATGNFEDCTCPKPEGLNPPGPKNF